MSPTALVCRLCLCSSSEYKALVDENGQKNLVYEIAAKYFDQMLLTTVICGECWQHIDGFHEFQQSVLQAQANLEEANAPPVKLEPMDIVEQNNVDTFENTEQLVGLETESVKQGTSPQPYIRKRKRTILEHDLVNAIIDIKLRKKSVYSVACHYEIPNSNIYRYIKSLDAEDVDIKNPDEVLDFVKRHTKQGGTTVFSKTQEIALTNYITRTTKLTYGFNINNLRSFAYEYANKLKIPYPENWNATKLAARDWYYGFKKRNENALFPNSEKQIARRGKHFSKANINKFFENLSGLFNEYEFEPNKIWNVDEMDFSIDPTIAVNVVAEKELKCRSHVTMALGVNALGQSIPPFYLFPRKSIKLDCFEIMTAGSVGFGNEHGSMTAADFVIFLKHFIKFSNAVNEKPSLLILNSHVSHLTIEAFDLADEHGIEILSFPHCSPRMQPLHAAVFEPLKTLYCLQRDAWLKSNVEKRLETKDILGIIVKCLAVGLSPENIQRAFEESGVYPINPFILTDNNSNGTNIGIKNISTAQPIIPALLNKYNSFQGDKSHEIDPLQLKPMENKILLSSEIKLEDQEMKEEYNFKTTTTTTENKILASLEIKSEYQEQDQKDECKTETTITANEAYTIKALTSSSISNVCKICFNEMPLKLNSFNSVNCNTCNRFVHLQCATITASYYTCGDCDSEYSDEV